MKEKLTTIVLATIVVTGTVFLISRVFAIPFPGNHIGYEPEQPIRFSHRLHCTELQIDCMYCHHTATKARSAGFPPASVCMNCHKTVTASWSTIQEEAKLAKKENRKPRLIISPELAKLYEAMGLDSDLRASGKKTKPIRWIRVHNLPDYSCFDHRPHIAAGVACQKCHGPVETMERVRQVERLSMGWCVNCHREANQRGINGKKVNASLDCSACHY